MKKFILGLTITLTMFSCGKKDENNNNNNNLIANQQYVIQGGGCFDRVNNLYVQQNLCTANTGYVLQNGLCISTTTGQQAPIQYCQNTGGNTGYVYQNGACYSTMTGQYVALTYCQQNNNNMGIVSQQCTGLYYYQNQQVQCYSNAQGSNCRGYLLRNEYGQQVQCL